MRYSPEETKIKALYLLGLKAQDDVRYTQFCLTMMERLKVSSQFVEQLVVNYSQGKI